ncbi:NAD(P)H-dependent glycerol-3-phosphate dehydrogenase [Pseudooceanicola sp. 216_PA32_1]|uniref:Glycerol-3-phosphate dehydrogenase [NAD(P)+] n=1 Tax=Pseudooceanicola pacificus TaxID=2676438 RepID=A0A844W818_9RHOB|nr:NAD(P)H-dependent glycerol-3-phosphate dehydrogenase [Pseudooceanicola pacificus]MWB76903.1 NAD(P)H-dependent glycerol-3-phosphate dehydrogenase [Pseudooceanicola pacificus]
MTGVIGAGAFGTALAISLSQDGDPVTLWARNADHAAAMRAGRENAARLPGARLPDSLSVTADITALPATGPLLLAVPMQQLRAMTTQHAAVLAGRRVVACCKGIELSTGLGPSGVLAQTLPDSTHALLTGPGFARDIARGLPTAMSLACADHDVARALQTALSTANLRLYRTPDTAGAEIGGALKNVIAIACGAAMGAGLGESARAALMTRGYAEMQRLALARGARAETLAGLSGFGDLTLTCTSEQSRNYAFGLSIGRGATFDTRITVEGAATARAVDDTARDMALDMPITGVVVALIDGRIDMSRALDMLLSRPLKEE